jgi:uncharacterized protein YeaC (DUF1315 family)
MKIQIMELIMDINKATSEINWVIKLVESVQSKEQLDTALKCFFLWESKHNANKSHHPLKSNMKSKFWASYRTKETQFSFPKHPKI